MPVSFTMILTFEPWRCTSMVMVGLVELYLTALEMRLVSISSSESGFRCNTTSSNCEHFTFIWLLSNKGPNEVSSTFKVCANELTKQLKR